MSAFLIFLAFFSKGTHPNYYPAPPYYQPAPWVQGAPMQVAGPGLINTSCVTTVVGKGLVMTVCP